MSGFSVIVPNSSYFASSKTKESDGEEDVNRGPVRRSPKSEILFTKSLRGCLTLFESFRNAAKKYPNRPCLGSRVVDSQGNVGRFLFKSYNWCSRTSDELAAGLVKEDLIPSTAAPRTLEGCCRTRGRRPASRPCPWSRGLRWAPVKGGRG